MGAELKIRTVKSVSWNLIGRMGVFGMNIILGIILARLLTPKDYGLIGLIAVFFSISAIFINSGLGMAYIRKKTVNDTDANTVFFINLVISLVIYILLWFFAPVIASFYDQPILVELTRVYGFIVIINAFRIIQDSQIRRELNFKKRTKFTLLSTLISGIAGITSAYYGLGVWSLVIQQLLNSFILTFGLAVTNTWKPSFNFSKDSMTSMFNFGSWVLFNGLMREIFRHIYVLIIGKFFPIAQAGFYTQARDFERKITTGISMSVVEVSFPMLSKNQNDKPKTKREFRKFLMHTMFIIVPIFTVLITVSDSFVLFMLKEKWAPMIPYLRLFAVIGVFFPMSSMNNQLMYALGRSKLNFNIGLVTNTLRVLNIIVMINFGVIYIILGEVILSLINIIIYVFFTNKEIGYGFVSQFNDLKFIFIGAFISGIAGYSLHYFTEKNYLLLFGGSLIVVMFYLVFQLLFNKNQFSELILLLKTLKQNKIKQ